MWSVTSPVTVDLQLAWETDDHDYVSEPAGVMNFYGDVFEPAGVMNSYDDVSEPAGTTPS